MRKITKKTRESIIKDYNNGVKQKDMSTKYNVAQSSVSRIIKYYKYEQEIKELEKKKKELLNFIPNKIPSVYEDKYLYIKHRIGGAFLVCEEISRDICKAYKGYGDIILNDRLNINGKPITNSFYPIVHAIIIAHTIYPTTVTIHINTPYDQNTSSIHIHKLSDHAIDKRLFNDIDFILAHYYNLMIIDKYKSKIFNEVFSMIKDVLSDE